jgi:hypothetical protein
VIKLRHQQPSLWHSGLAKDIEDLWEPWMREVDQLLEDAAFCVSGESALTAAVLISGRLFCWSPGNRSRAYPLIPWDVESATRETISLPVDATMIMTGAFPKRIGLDL